MGKRKSLSDDEAQLDYEEEDEEIKPKKKRQSAPKKPKITEPFVDKLGWNVEPPSLIWRNFGDVEASKKIAAFDLDSTLVNRKSNAKFARDAADWKWWNKQTPKKLAELADDGYKIVIFSNQGSIKGALDGKAKEKVESMVELIYNDLQEKVKEDVPMQVFLAPSMEAGDPCRKPETGMWRFMVENCNDGITPDLKHSFFVGDADGSPGAFSDADIKFAQGVGMPFKTPQDFFGQIEGKAVIDSDAVKAAAADVESGANPNSDLIKQMLALAEETFELKKTTGDVKLQFKAAAYKTAANALSTYPEQISEDNLKAVGKLKGVGKGTLERIKQYLSTGSVKLPEEQDAGAAAAAPAAEPVMTKEKKQAFAFM